MKTCAREHAGGSPAIAFENSSEIPVERWQEDHFAIPIKTVGFDFEAVYAHDEGQQYNSAAPAQLRARLKALIGDRPEAIGELEQICLQISAAAYAAGLEDGRKQQEETFTEVLRWMDGYGRGTFSGLANRAACCQWLFNSDYAEFTQTDLLLRYGLENKQLLNRETVSFRDRFHQADSRFYSERARETYRRREQAKRSACERGQVEDASRRD